MPAAAQTVTISASGNCAGTPANCGTSGNRNGDRDTTWPGLQVDEGDQLTFTISLDRFTNPTDSVVVGVAFSGSGYTSGDLSINSGFGSAITSPITTALVSALGLTRQRTLNVTSDGATEGDETVSATLSSVLSAGYTIGTPSSTTVTIRGTDSAPTFGTGSVTNKTYIAGSAIADFTVPAASGGNGGTFTYAASNLPDGLVFDATGTDSPAAQAPRPARSAAPPPRPARPRPSPSPRTTRTAT